MKAKLNPKGLKIAQYSETHSITETAEHFNISKETIYAYRTQAKKEGMNITFIKQKNREISKSSKTKLNARKTVFEQLKERFEFYKKEAEKYQLAMIALNEIGE